MTNQEILEKAIQKAIDGGWKTEHPELHVDDDGYGDLSIGFAITADDSDLTWWSEDYDVLSVNDVIFDHDFAKALWGHEPVGASVAYDYTNGRHYNTPVPKWEAYLQQMVIAEDPIKYLGENI